MTERTFGNKGSYQNKFKTENLDLFGSFFYNDLSFFLLDHFGHLFNLLLIFFVNLRIPLIFGHLPF